LSSVVGKDVKKRLKEAIAKVNNNFEGGNYV
jgi:hypothetical protein